MTQADSLVRSFPFDRPPFGPPGEYSEYRLQGGLSKVRLWDGSLAWLATRFDDVRALTADNRLSATPLEGYPFISEGMAAMVRGEPLPFVRMDPPEHTALRRMFTAEFTHARIQALRPLVEKIVGKLIDQLLAKGPPSDFITSFGLALPSLVIAEMLGVPYEDHDFFQERSARKTRLDNDPQTATLAGEEIRAYLGELLARKEKNPESYDDIMGRLIVNHIRTGNIDYVDAVRTLEMLLMAGHETTATMLALGTVSLLQNPGAFEQLRANPAPELVRQAVEEMLRFHTIAQYGQARVALEDIEYRGQTIRKGEGVLAMIVAANHDPNKFVNPERFDINARSVSPHVAFGFGIHQCLGQPLARLEMQATFQALPRRIPTLRLDLPVEHLRFKPNSLVHALQALPLTW